MSDQHNLVHCWRAYSHHHPARTFLFFWLQTAGVLALVDYVWRELAVAGANGALSLVFLSIGAAVGALLPYAALRLTNAAGGDSTPTSPAA